MSISLSINNNLLNLKKLNLPTRYYHFNQDENYIKFLSVGEGIFPRDKINTNIKLFNSNYIFTTESATKVYPSDGNFGLNSINIELSNSNCEFLNDELILYKNSKFIELLNIKSDKNSTFFYTSILSHGRSFEIFDFTQMLARNKFTIDKELEYYENYDINGKYLKNYFQRHELNDAIFAKIYIKSKDNEYLREALFANNFVSFSYTKTKKMIIGVISSNSMHKLKQNINKVWKIYRKSLNKSEFDLGKQ